MKKYQYYRNNVLTEVEVPFLPGDRVVSNELGMRGTVEGYYGEKITGALVKFDNGTTHVCQWKEMK